MPRITPQNASTILNELLPQVVSQEKETTDINGIEPGEEGYISTLETTTVEHTDLSLLSSFGREYEKLPTHSQNSFVSGLVSLIQEQLMITRKYIKTMPDISRGYNTESGGILQKNRMKQLQYKAKSNEVVYNPEPGSVTTHFEVYSFEVDTEYFGSPISKKIEVTIPDIDTWTTGMFKSPENFMEFVGMILTNVENELDLHIETLTRGIIINAILAVYDYNAGSQLERVQTIPLVTKYNNQFGESLTPETCIYDEAFHRYAITIIQDVQEVLMAYNSLNNIKGFQSQTPMSEAYFYMNSAFVNINKNYLLTDVYNNEFLKLKGYRTVPFWQSLGTGSNIFDRFKLHATIEVPWESDPIEVEKSNVIGMICHKDAIATYAEKRKSDAEADVIGERLNYYHKHTVNTLIDFAEDFVVFTLD